MKNLKITILFLNLCCACVLIGCNNGSSSDHANTSATLHPASISLNDILTQDSATNIRLATISGTSSNYMRYGFAGDLTLTGLTFNFYADDSCSTSPIDKSSFMGLYRVKGNSRYSLNDHGDYMLCSYTSNGCDYLMRNSNSLRITFTASNNIKLQGPCYTDNRLANTTAEPLSACTNSSCNLENPPNLPGGSPYSTVTPVLSEPFLYVATSNQNVPYDKDTGYFTKTDTISYLLKCAWNGSNGNLKTCTHVNSDSTMEQKSSISGSITHIIFNTSSDSSSSVNAYIVANSSPNNGVGKMNILHCKVDNNGDFSQCNNNLFTYGSSLSYNDTTYYNIHQKISAFAIINSSDDQQFALVMIDGIGSRENRNGAPFDAYYSMLYRCTISGDGSLNIGSDFATNCIAVTTPAGILTNQNIQRINDFSTPHYMSFRVFDILANNGTSKNRYITFLPAPFAKASTSDTTTKTTLTALICTISDDGLEVSGCHDTHSSSSTISFGQMYIGSEYKNFAYTYDIGHTPNLFKTLKTFSLTNGMFDADNDWFDYTSIPHSQGTVGSEMKDLYHLAANFIPELILSEGGKHFTMYIPTGFQLLGAPLATDSSYPGAIGVDPTTKLPDDSNNFSVYLPNNVDNCNSYSYSCLFTDLYDANNQQLPWNPTLVALGSF